MPLLKREHSDSFSATKALGAGDEPNGEGCIPGTFMHPPPADTTLTRCSWWSNCCLKGWDFLGCALGFSMW